MKYQTKRYIYAFFLAYIKVYLVAFNLERQVPAFYRAGSLYLNKISTFATKETREYSEDSPTNWYKTYIYKFADAVKGLASSPPQKGKQDKKKKNKLDQEQLQTIGIGSVVEQTIGWLRPPAPLKVESCAQLEELVDRQGFTFDRLSVTGEDVLLSPKHPVAKLIQQRIRDQSIPGSRSDKFKLGLAIEGGGMRGAVSAGMAACIEYLGYADAFDAIYGASAGSVIGAYFVTRQLDAVSIYTEILPAAGQEFINHNNLVKAAFGIEAPRFLQIRASKRRKRVQDKMRSLGIRPSLPVVGRVLNLDFLMETIVTTRPLSWEVFWANNQLQPLKIIASCCNAMKSRMLSSKEGHFSNIDQLLHCLKASMNVPGAGGPPVSFPAFSEEVFSEEDKQELLVDALMFEPLPYRSAVEDGCTHVLMLRTRPNGAEVMGANTTIYESVVCQQYFRKDYNLLPLADFCKSLKTVRIYAEDVLTLNSANKNYEEPTPLPKFPVNCAGSGKKAYLMTLAVPTGTPEVSQLTTEQKKVVDGVRAGFATAYDALAPKVLKKAISGQDLALLFYPDSLLETQADLTEIRNFSPKEIAQNSKPHPVSLLIRNS